ncbi:MAG: hypothetical protein HKN59_09085 [Gammaproteobacteria bacterium]|nr:hypothetical protein [Gammaproteobacteria bacterium]
MRSGKALDKVKLRELAIELENAIDAACEKGINEAEQFKPYAAQQIADAKAMKIDATVEFNTHGAWHYWFSETDLGECNEIMSAFARFSDVLTGDDQDPAIQRLTKRMQAIKDELFPPEKK